MSSVTESKMEEQSFTLGGDFLTGDDPFLVGDDPFPDGFLVGDDPLAFLGDDAMGA